MAIMTPPFRLNRFARQLRRDGVTSVRINIEEHDIPLADGRARRVLEPVIVAETRTFRMGPDVYPTPLTWQQIRGSVGMVLHRQRVAGLALRAAEVLEGKGVRVPIINGVLKEQVEDELRGRAGHGPERY